MPQSTKKASWSDDIDDRTKKDIEHASHYVKNFNHGGAGHQQLNTIAILHDKIEKLWEFVHAHDQDSEAAKAVAAAPGSANSSASPVADKSPASAEDGSAKKDAKS